MRVSVGGTKIEGVLEKAKLEVCVQGSWSVEERGVTGEGEYGSVGKLERLVDCW